LSFAGTRLLAPIAFGHDPYLDIRRLAQKWSTPVGTVFDVGANIGQTVARTRRIFGPSTRIICFEPHPTTFQALRGAINHLRNVEAHQVALSSVNGEATLFEYEASELNSLNSSAPYNVRFPMRGTPKAVSASTLDSFCISAGVNRIDVLKIDTEGHDIDVLQGAERLLSEHRIRFVYFEFNDIQADSRAQGGALLPIDTLLRRHGLRFVATYSDYIVTDGDLFQVANALYALPRNEKIGA
jgi:FkbM family methyltransferase